MAIFKQLYLAVIILVFLLAGSIYAVDRDAEIVAFTDKAIAHMKKVGNQQAYKDFKNRNGEFFKGEVYVVTLDLDGICRSQPVNPRLIGKNFISFRDSSGALFVQEIITNLKKNGGVTWIEYNWVHPKTKKVNRKRALAKMIDKKEFTLIGYWP